MPSVCKASTIWASVQPRLAICNRSFASFAYRSRIAEVDLHEACGVPARVSF
jgi:hypothetical protein